MLPAFDLLRPRTLPEALAILAESPDVIPLAGGTNLIVDLRDGRRAPKKVMDVSRLRELRGIGGDDGQIVIGGGTTITELLMHPLIAEHGRPLQQAAARLGNPLVRNRATVAGNLANASPAADTAPPLMVLDAVVDLVNRNGTRSVPLCEFMIGVSKTLLRSDELLASVRWPVPPANSAAGFYKIGLRKADACSVINAAAMIVWDEGGVCLQARIAIGAAAPRPVRAREAEAALLGQPLNSDVVEKAARLAVRAIQPIDDIRGTASHRHRLTEVIVRRLLVQIAERQTAGRWQS
jgi:CO/xanthine dehydrogenase FAD-binding subunit